MVFQADVRDPGAVNDMVESTLKEFGKIDVLVNNECGRPRFDPNGCDSRTTQRST
jgi:NADP-dependent 3-hydroxy acid dehydrogenase YdfG